MKFSFVSFSLFQTLRSLVRRAHSAPGPRMPFAHLVALAVLATPGVLLAQTGVPVKIWGSATVAGGTSLGEASLGFMATFEASSPGVNDAYYVGADDNSTAGISVPVKTVQLQPEKTYELQVEAERVTALILRMVPPPGYVLEIDGMVRSRVAISGIASPYEHYQTMTVRLVGQANVNSPPVGAGASSSLGAGERIEWEIGMGALKNGRSAGTLALIDAGTAAAWSTLFTPTALSYAAVSSEVQVHRSAGELRQILANEAAVDIVTLSSTSYEIRFYHPDQASGSTFPRTFGGLPYVIYKVEQGGTSTTLKITSYTRNITSLSDTSAGVVREATTSIARTGSSWPAYTWTRRDWTTVGQTPLTEVVAASSSGSGVTRNLSLAEQGYNGGTVATQVNR